MTHARVTGVRSIELAVRDLQQSSDFYSKVWALEPVATEADTIQFRATGGEHHVLTIRERKKPALLGVHFAASDRNAVDALHAKAKSYGVEVTSAPDIAARIWLDGAPAVPQRSGTGMTFCQ